MAIQVTKADIEIAVKGINKLKQATDSTKKLSQEVNKIRREAAKDIFGKLPKDSQKLILSTNNLNKAFAKSKTNLNKVAIDTKKYFEVISDVVDNELRLNSAVKKQARDRKIVERLKSKGLSINKKNIQIVRDELAQELKLARAKERTAKAEAAGKASRTKIAKGVRGAGNAISSAAISGAFPLLFGQGPAAAAGGFSGGLIGTALGGQMGGFAGGLIGTASVTAFQEQVLGLANAFDPLNADIDAAIEKVGGLSSARKQEIKIIEQFRGKQAALKEITKDLTKVVGEDGVKAFRELREAAKLFTDKFGNFALKTKASVAEIVNNLREFVDPGGLDFAKAQKGLESIDDSTIKELNERLAKLEKSLKDAPGINLGEALTFGVFNQKGIATKVANQQTIKDDISSVKNNIKETAAKKAGLIIDKQASAALENQVKATELELENQQKLNAVRTEGRFVISKGLAEELLALNKLNDERKQIFQTKKESAQKIIEELKGNEELSEQDKERLANARLTVESIDAQVAANNKNFESLKKNTLEARKLQNAANETVDAFENLNTTIQNDIKQGIAGLIKGTSTLSDLLNNVADRFLDIALNQGLFGNAGGKTVTGGLFKLLGFADGGRPPVNRPSIVGEKGPELFVPRSSGNIIPNNKLGGGNTNNVVVNVDASGSDVQGDEAAAKELGSLISVAVQGELLKQQRPGGLLSR